MDITQGLLDRPSWRDYLELCKPNVVLLMLLCSIVGMFLATSGMVPIDILIFGNLGLALVAGSAAALNHLIDATIDSKMARTRNRPVAQGRISQEEGAIFIAATGLSGLAILYFLVNPLTAALNLTSWVGYGIIYSLYLKRATPQNIVIGGVFGAAPPLFGWTAVTNSIDPGGLLLLLIIFAWTPPHFWALAIDRVEDYRKLEDVPMLPVTHGIHQTKIQILIYTVILFAISLVPTLISMSGVLYLVAATLLGTIFTCYAVAMLTLDDPKLPIQTFKYSIVYLGFLFTALLIDHYFFLPFFQ